MQANFFPIILSPPIVDEKSFLFDAIACVHTLDFPSYVHRDTCSIYLYSTVNLSTKEKGCDEPDTSTEQTKGDGDHSHVRQVDHEIGRAHV